MRRKRRGTLIHISSLAAFSFNAVSGASYTAAKLGMLGMSDSINAEEGINGIRSIAICPGEVATPILNSRPKPPSERGARPDGAAGGHRRRVAVLRQPAADAPACPASSSIRPTTVSCGPTPSHRGPAAA